MADDQIFNKDLERRVRGYVRARVPKEDAEDVINDAWLRIVKNQSKYDPERGPVWPWAKYHCKSAIADYYRRRQPDPYDGDGPTVESDPSPSEYEILLEVTFTAPSDLHQLIAFAFVQLLEWRPAEVVAELSDQALEDLGNRFVVDYSSHFSRHHRNVVLDLLRPFTERLRGARARLIDFFSEPADEKKRAEKISRWRYSVQRRIRSDLVRRYVSLEGKKP